MPPLLVSRRSVHGHAWIPSTNADSRAEDMGTLRTSGHVSHELADLI